MSRLVHNWRLKLAALGLSVFLWALVQTEPLSQEVFTAVPVYVDVADTAWTSSGAPSPATVELRLGGPAGEIIRLAREGPSVRIPVETVGTLDTLIALRSDWIFLGDRPGVTIESITPPAVRVSFEKAVTRMVPLSPRLQGTVPDHLALAGPISLSPGDVTVRGPESRVAGLESIRLMPFDLSRVRESGMFTVMVDTTGLAGGWVVPSTAALGVEVEAQVERTLAGLVVRAEIEDGGTDIMVSPSTVQVRLTGARTLVTAVAPGSLRVWVPPEALRGMAPGEERRVPIRVDGAPSLVTVVPALELVTVRRAADHTDPSAPL